jgi:hypothetical protein
MKAEGKPLFRPQSAPGAVEKRSRDGGETQPSAFQADWVLPGLKRVILTGQQTPEGIADFYLSRGVKAVVIKPAATAPGSKAPAANRERSMPLKSITSSIPSAPAMALPSG